MRNILFILLLCNVMLLKAQSLELEHWRIINSSEIADADARGFATILSNNRVVSGYGSHYCAECFGERECISRPAYRTQ